MFFVELQIQSGSEVKPALQMHLSRGLKRLLEMPLHPHPQKNTKAHSSKDKGPFSVFSGETILLLQFRCFLVWQLVLSQFPFHH
jgi:hypothetical protein